MADNNWSAPLFHATKLLRRSSEQASASDWLAAKGMLDLSLAWIRDARAAMEVEEGRRKALEEHKSA